MGDPNYFTRVVVELLENRIDMSPARIGATVQVRTVVIILTLQPVYGCRKSARHFAGNRYLFRICEVTI